MKTWIQIAKRDDVVTNGGSRVLLGGVQVALFKPVSGTQTKWYAAQSLCLRDTRQVLLQGLTGDA